MREQPKGWRRLAQVPDRHPGGGTVVEGNLGEALGLSGSAEVVPARRT
jgi:hypothetical protein